MRRLLLFPIPVLFALGCTGGAHGPARSTGDPIVVREVAAPREDVPGLRNFAQVSDDLYRGGQPTREGFEELRRMGVRTVINLRGESDADRALVEGLGFNYVYLPTTAWAIGPRQVEAVLRVISDPANRPVYVHCRRGADRTGCVVAAYRMVAQDWSAKEAMAELPRFRFAPIFFNIPRFLARLDAAALRERTAITAGQPAATASATAADDDAEATAVR